MWKQSSLHRFRPLASYRYDTALVSTEKLTSPPMTPLVGELIRDEDLGFYLYQMSFQDLRGNSRKLEGIFGILELGLSEQHVMSSNPYNQDQCIRNHLLAHEQTISSGTGVNSDDFNSTISRPGTGPVWGISVQNLIRADTIQRGKNLTSVKDASGVTHEVWQITEREQLRCIESAVEKSQLIIADGHHRIDRAFKKLALAKPGTTVKLLSFITDIDPFQAEIRPIHRCFKTRLSNDETLRRLKHNFQVIPYDDISASHYQDADTLLVLLRDRAFQVKPANGETPIIDAVLSQSIAKVLEARSTQYITDIDKLKTRVNSDPTKIALVNRPPTLNQIRLAALSKTPFPPKSTMFYPKPLPGLVFGDCLNF